MMLYIAIFGFLILLRYALMGHPKSRNQVYLLVLAGLFLFSAFRFEVGCDWSGYFNQFELQTASPLAAALNMREPLWWLIMGGIIKLGLPYPWVNVAASAIFFSGIHVLARRQKDPLGFLILLYPILIINMPMSALRQASAIGVLAIAFVAFTDKRLTRFVILTLIASTLHASALVFLLLVPLVKGKYTKNRFILAGILAIPGALLLVGNSNSQLAITRYVNSGVEATGAEARVGLLVVSAMFFFLALRKQWKRQFSYDYKLVSLTALIMLALAPMVSYSTVIADRLGYGLVLFQAVMFSRIPYLALTKGRMIYTAAPYFVLFLTLTAWSIYSWHFQQCYLPYRSWIFGFPTSKY